MVPAIPQPNLNLDRLAAQRAQQLIHDTLGQNAGDIDNSVTKALGVLQENGFYACFLFLFSKNPTGSDAIARELVGLVHALGFGWPLPNWQDRTAVLAFVTNHVTADLERMILAKETAEQMLIYARYGAKARD